MCSLMGRRRRSDRSAATGAAATAINLSPHTCLRVSVGASAVGPSCVPSRPSLVPPAVPTQPSAQAGSLVTQQPEAERGSGLGYFTPVNSTLSRAGCPQDPQPVQPPLPLHQPPLVWPEPWGILPGQWQLVHTAAPAPGVPGTVLLCRGICGTLIPAQARPWLAQQGD